MFKEKMLGIILLFIFLFNTSAWGMSINATMTGFSVPETNLFNTAFSLWEKTIRDPFEVTVNIHKTHLPGSVLGRSFNFTQNSSGMPVSASIEINDLVGSYAGWFVDATPWDDAEFNSGKNPSHFVADAGGPADGLFDLFTVIDHELCHVLGFTINYSLFAKNVSNNSDGMRMYSGKTISASLTSVYEGTHLSSLHPYDLMNPMLSRGDRFYSSFLDVSILADAFAYDAVIPPQPPDPHPVPEPSTLFLFAAGLACLAAFHFYDVSRDQRLIKKIKIGESMSARKHSMFAVFILVAITLVFALSFKAHAIPAAPVAHILSQPDGTTFEAMQWGDENLNGWETQEGYTIVFDEDLNSWVYAGHGPDGSLVSSRRVVGKEGPPSTLEKRLRPKDEALAKTIFKRLSRELRVSQQEEDISPTAELIVPPTGTANIPIVLINFNDRTTTYTAGNFNTLLFGTGNYSMKDYYNEVSYGAFSVSAGPGGVVGWYTAANGHDYYGYSNGFTRAARLAKEAVTAADFAGFNFAPYDQDGDCYVDVANIVHQGAGTEASGNTTDIWSHRWNFAEAGIGIYTTNDACPAGGFIKINDYVIQPEILWGSQQTMGVFAHEYGHALGLPDLYDTDGSSEGIGNWSLMAAGSWTYAATPGDRPSHMDAWCKYWLGWVTPTEVSGTLVNEPIVQASTSANVYKLLNGTPLSGEYFLVENRQRTGFDAGLPGAGLLIWHIDAATGSNRYECYPGGPSCASQHYKVALVQADNLWDMEKNLDRGDAGDPYPGSTGNTTFNGGSSPASNLYNGSPSNVSVTGISASGSTMYATLSRVVSKPDLIVQGISTSPNTPYEGQNVSVTITVKNQGGAAAGAFSVDFYKHQDTAPGPYAVGDFACSKTSLAAGATDTCIGTVSYAAVGTYQMWAQVDTYQQVTESDEANNVFGPQSIAVNYAPGADLIVTSITGPTAAAPGSTITIGDTTLNQGTGTAAASTTKFYWSTNNTWDAGDTLIGSRALPILTPGATDTGTISVTVPNTCSPGAVTFYIIAKADAGGAVSEANENNNNKSKSIKVGPDLIVSAVTTSPLTSGAEKTLNVIDTTKNQGGCSAGTSTTRFYLSSNSTWDTGDTAIGERTVPPLSASGGTDTATTPMTIPAGTATGTWYIIAKADAATVVPETSETNNNKAKSIKIGPDLRVSSITAPTSAVNGSTITIGDTTKNNGGGDAGASTTNLYLSTDTTYSDGDTLLRSRTVTLNAGATNTLSGPVTLPSVTPGVYYIVAVSDAGSAVTETNETNNTKFKAITIN